VRNGRKKDEFGAVGWGRWVLTADVRRMLSAVFLPDRINPNQVARWLGSDLVGHNRLAKAVPVSLGST
jgi:hypothetical protein